MGTIRGCCKLGTSTSGSWALGHCSRARGFTTRSGQLCRLQLRTEGNGVTYLVCLVVLRDYPIIFLKCLSVFCDVSISGYGLLATTDHRQVSSCAHQRMASLLVCMIIHHVPLYHIGSICLEALHT